MNTQIIKNFFSEPDESGKKVTAFCFCVSGAFGVIAGGLLGILRFTRGNLGAGWIYLTLCLLSGGVFLYSLRNIKQKNYERLSWLSFPLVVGGFIFLLTALFFLDGGTNGGVPMFFILAVIITPCYLKISDALIMLCLEIFAYALNIIFASYYPESVGAVLNQSNNNIK